MPEYKAPGVYVEEVERGPKPIEGVSTSVAGFVGVTERGPTEPELVTSFADYYRTFGGFETDSEWTNLGYETSLPYAVDGYFRNGGRRAWIARVVPNDWITNDRVATATLEDSEDNTVLTARTVGVGWWGNNVAINVVPASSGAADRFNLQIGYWRNPDDLTLAWEDLTDPENEGPPDHEEVYEDLSADRTERNYYETVVNEASTLVTLSPGTSTESPSEETTALTLGTDPDDVDTAAGDYNGEAITGQRIGLERFEEVDEITMVNVPDENVHDVREDVKDHCENQEDRIAILSAEEGADLDGFPDDALRSEYAALYHPWLTIRDPETELEIPVPPGGHVAGIYARSDAEHGVHKAPANERVRGIRDLNATITQGEQETLNPEGVNCIRSFRGRGNLVWGARTTSDDPSWKYVNVRRLFLYVEESIDEGTQWVVFEPNDETLWARVRQTVSNFLTGVWEDGALMGTTPDEAFYVKCDRTTMTQNDIDNGRLICEIGIAPVKPAEFVVFRISQTTAGAQGGG